MSSNYTEPPSKIPSITGNFHVKEVMSSTNWNEYMIACGVSFLKDRWALRFAAVRNIITKEGDQWTIKTEFDSKRKEEMNFKLGEEFDEVTFHGYACKSIITQEGDDKLIQIRKYVNSPKTTKFTREFTNVEMKMTMEGPGDVVATLTFRRDCPCMGCTMRWHAEHRTVTTPPEFLPDWVKRQEEKRQEERRQEQKRREERRRKS